MRKQLRAKKKPNTIPTYVFGCTKSCCLAWAFSSGSAQASPSGGFSYCGAQVLDAQALAVAVRGPRNLWCMGLVAPWHGESFQTRIKPMPSALAGRFLSTVPLGKS